MRDDDPGQVPLEGTALRGARWSLLEVLDRDGKWLLIAHRSTSATHGLELLSPRERQALALKSVGLTNKLIAYEMGLSSSTVGVLLFRASSKLRALSRVDPLEIGAQPAEAEAPLSEMRAALSRAVLAIETSRRRKRPVGPFRCSSAPSRLPNRWTLIDQFDGDGHHFIVARSSDRDARCLDILTRREREVAV
jgi:DNA-binding CsgD family transcriptional regulator